MFRKFFTNPAFVLVAAIVGLGGLRAVLPAPTYDNGIRFVQANIGGKSDLVRVNTNAKMVHYHGTLHWDDARRETFTIYKKDGKLITLAMYADRPWTFREPTADEAALWRSLFNT